MYRLYFLFEIRPWSGKLGRALRRETKAYLFDATEVPEAGPRFENVVALHLYKLCDYWTDLGFGDFELRYVRSVQLVRNLSIARTSPKADVRVLPASWLLSRA